MPSIPQTPKLRVHLIKTVFNFITWLQMLFVSVMQTLHLPDLHFPGKNIKIQLKL